MVLWTIVCKANRCKALPYMRIKRIIATKLLVSSIELLNFRSKFLGLVPENLHTKILTNSNWLRYFLFSLVLFLFSFIAKKKKEMNISKINNSNNWKISEGTARRENSTCWPSRYAITLTLTLSHWRGNFLAASLLSRLAASPKTPRPTGEDENQYEFMSIRFSGEGTTRREISICCLAATR